MVGITKEFDGHGAFAWAAGGAAMLGVRARPRLDEDQCGSGHIGATIPLAPCFICMQYVYRSGWAARSAP